MQLINFLPLSFVQHRQEWHGLEHSALYRIYAHADINSKVYVNCFWEPRKTPFQKVFRGSCELQVAIIARLTTSYLAEQTPYKLPRKTSVFRGSHYSIVIVAASLKSLEWISARFASVEP